MMFSYIKFTLGSLHILYEEHMQRLNSNRRVVPTTEPQKHDFGLCRACFRDHGWRNSRAPPALMASLRALYAPF